MQETLKQEELLKPPPIEQEAETFSTRRTNPQEPESEYTIEFDLDLGGTDWKMVTIPKTNELQVFPFIVEMEIEVQPNVFEYHEVYLIDILVTGSPQGTAGQLEENLNVFVPSTCNYAAIFVYNQSGYVRQPPRVPNGKQIIIIQEDKTFKYIKHIVSH